MGLYVTIEWTACIQDNGKLTILTLVSEAGRVCNIDEIRAKKACEYEYCIEIYS